MRNRIKRVLREAVRTAILQPGWDFVVIVRVPAAESDYHILDNSMSKLLNRACIMGKQNEKNCSGND